MKKNQTKVSETTVFAMILLVAVAIITFFLIDSSFNYMRYSNDKTLLTLFPYFAIGGVLLYIVNLILKHLG